MKPTFDGHPAALPQLAGDAAARGAAHGRLFAPHIRHNLAYLLEQTGTDRKLDASAPYQRWVERQAKFNERLFPGCIAEVEAIASTSGLPLKRLLDLTFIVGWENFEAEFAGPGPAAQCSLLAVTSADGQVLCASTLDDPPEIWPTPVRVAPEGGYSYVTTLWPGTSWAGRGMNSAGLCLGTAGFGARKRERAYYRDTDQVNLGFANRALLTQCATVADARHFLREHPFTMNLVCVDAQGGLLAAHQTEEGPLEVQRDGAASLANTAVDDAAAWTLGRSGYSLYPEHPTSRFRHGLLADFVARRNHRATFEEVAALFAARGDDPGHVCHALTAWATLASPQTSPSYWLCRPSDPAAPATFSEYRP